jgi:hypothetical protein
MNELAHDLMEEIKRDPLLGKHWNRGHRATTSRGHSWELKLPPIVRLLLSLIQFADDITIVAGSPQATERLLHITWRWAARHKVVLSDKSFTILLAAAHPTEIFNGFPHGPEPLKAGELELAWNYTQEFILLGVRCQAAHYSAQSIQVHSVDEKKVNRIMAIVTAPFSMGKDRHYVSLTALRLGIEQLVYATLLYETAIQDIDYGKLQQVVVRRCRHVLHLQPTTPTAYLMWELRLWPARLRAHKRALMFAAQLFHHTWFGKRILQPYLCEDVRRERHVQDIHPIFHMGPLRRLTEILAEYKLSWYHVSAKWNKPRKERHVISREINRTIMIPGYMRFLHSLATTSEDIPQNHRHQLLRDMSLPGPRDSSVIREAPLYHSLSHGLSIAGVVFRAPYLRHQYRGAAHATRATCEWCGSWDSEYGHHLVRCTNSPPEIMAYRDRALRMIHADVHAGIDSGNPQAHLDEENIHRLFSLYWQGRATWGPKGRKDKGKQPDREALQASLLYMQEAINAYAAEVPEVRPIPSFIHAPKPSADEIQRAMQAKAQYDLADSQDSPSVPREDLFLDSLQRLADAVEDD